MANFNINIEHIAPLYTLKYTSSFEEDCAPLDKSLPIVLEDSDTSVESMTSSYTGELVKTLTITNITSSNTGFFFSLNNVKIENEDLPLIVDITGIGVGTIPNVKVEEAFFITNIRESLSATFTITDINDAVGEPVTSYFQVNKVTCTS